jgi:diadenosine tetraphosphate (Ap4A) HIT family hydrolase
MSEDMSLLCLLNNQTRFQSAPASAGDFFGGIWYAGSMTTDPDCIFCKIVAKQVPATITYEDDTAIGFADLHPQAPGHMLLVPRDHYVWMQDVPDSLLAKLFITAKKLIPELKEKYSADYIKMSVIGVDVPHFHIHLIPMKQ